MIYINRIISRVVLRPWRCHQRVRPQLCCADSGAHWRASLFVAKFSRFAGESFFLSLPCQLFFQFKRNTSKDWNYSTEISDGGKCRVWYDYLTGEHRQGSHGVAVQSLHLFTRGVTLRPDPSPVSTFLFHSDGVSLGLKFNQLGASFNPIMMIILVMLMIGPADECS